MSYDRFEKWRDKCMKVGDKVKCVNAAGKNTLIEGNIYTVENFSKDYAMTYVSVKELPGDEWYIDRFELVTDIIKQPSHYTGRGGIEPLDFVSSNKMDFAEGSVVKYVYRYPFKGGVEDLKKARRYLDKMIERLEGECDEA